MNMRLACDQCGSQPCMCQEFECPICDGNGSYAYALGGLPMQHKVPCSECGASGWVKCDGPRDGTCRWETSNHSCQCEAAWERQQADIASEPPMSAREQHEAAYRQKQELRR